MKRIVLTIMVLAFAATLCAGCKTRKRFPDPDPGWHSADYTVLFGRLQRVPSRVADNAPVWVLRFGMGRDAYHGEVALTPAERMAGYNGGELVEVRGSLKADFNSPDYSGTGFDVQSIRIWAGYVGTRKK